MATVSVVIPCYPPHIHCLHALLTDLAKQTVQPDEVIIAISQINDVQATYLKDSLDKILTCLLIISNTPEPCLEGPNRNRGAKVATSKYVAFLDADDIYHPQKIELCCNLLEENNSDILVHGYFRQSESPMFQIYDQSKIKITPSESILHNTFGNPPKRLGGERGINGDTNINTGYAVAQGIAFTRRDVLDTVQYTTMSSGADGMFLRDACFNFGKKIIAIPEKLMIYVK